MAFQTAPNAASLDIPSEGYPGQAIVNSSGIFLGSSRLGLCLLNMQKWLSWAQIWPSFFPVENPCSSAQLRPCVTGSLPVFSASTHDSLFSGPPWASKSHATLSPLWDSRPTVTVPCSASWPPPQLPKAFYSVRVELNVPGPRVKRELCYVAGVLPLLLSTSGFSSVSWAS